MKGRNCCAAVNCKNRRSGRSNISYFRFPQDEPRCKEWVINCGRTDLVTMSAHELSQSYVVCALHFEDSAFSNLKKTRLQPGTAVPTIFNTPFPISLLEVQKPKKSYFPTITKQLRSRSLHLLNSKNKSETYHSPKPSSLATSNAQSRSQSSTSVIGSKCGTSKPRSPQTTNELPKSKSSQSVAHYRERLIVLKRKLDNQRKRIKRLEAAKQRVPRPTAKSEIAYIKAMSAKYLSAKTHSFFSYQLDLSLKKCKRWKPEEKNFALSLYLISPMAYRLLTKHFTLPSSGTLVRTIKLGRKVICDAPQESLSKDAQIGLSKDVQVGLSENAPIGLSENAPIGLSEVVPLDLSEDAPIDLSVDAPIGLSEIVPLDLSEDAPIGLLEDAQVGL